MSPAWTRAWPRAAAAVLGLWVTLSPDVIAHGDAAAASARIAGLLLASLSTVAVARAGVPLRWVTLAIGMWLLLSVPLLDLTGSAALSAGAAGVGAVALSLLPGRSDRPLGGGWAAVRNSGRDPAD